MQARLESSRVGRAFISAFIFLTLFSVIVWNLPDSELKRIPMPVVSRYINLTGLEQNWGVFAPDPRRETIDLVSRVTYDDGRESIWHVPRRNSVVGAYADYRWLKWLEFTYQDAGAELWKPAASFVARIHTSDERRPTTVRLIRRWQPLLPPGPGPERAQWNEAVLYTLSVRPGAETGRP